MPALKSDNQLNAWINRNFFIRVYLPDEKTTRLTSAKQCSKYILDEELKKRLFKKLLDSKTDTIIFKIRKRLKIEFHSK